MKKYIRELYYMVLVIKHFSPNIIKKAFDIDELLVSKHSGGVFGEKVISPSMRPEYLTVQEYINKLK